MASDPFHVDLSMWPALPHSVMAGFHGQAFRARAGQNYISLVTNLSLHIVPFHFIIASRHSSKLKRKLHRLHSLMEE